MSQSEASPPIDGDEAVEASFDLSPAADVLPSAVVDVLRRAFDLVRGRPGSTFDTTLTTRSARKTLDALAFPPLRRTVSREIARSLEQPAGDDDAITLAARLVARDDDVAASAARSVSRLLDQGRTDARSARRRERDSARPTAERRAREREETERERLRQARDRARGQLRSAVAERDQARERLADLQAELGLARTRQLAAEDMLEGLREASPSLVAAAESLCEALSPEQTGQTARPRSAGIDSLGRDLDALPPDRLLREAAESSLSDVMSPDARATVVSWLPRLLREVARPAVATRLADLELTVDVLGGGDEIGGSCVLISAGGTRILVDCGSRSGIDVASSTPPGIARALEDRLDAIVVTHAHNDHGGWVPAVIARQPHVPVLATPATCDLLVTMWHDSAKVFLSLPGAGESDGDGALLPYSATDVERACGRLVETPFTRCRRVGSLTVELFPAGHIVGAAGIVVTAGDRRVVVSGDVSGPGQATVGGFRETESARGADLLLLESTYAGRTGAGPRAKAVDEFVRSAARTAAEGGVALVPSFALGRAQEVALICAERLPDLDVLVDGLARDICETYERHPGPKGARQRIFRGNVRPVARGGTIDEVLRLRSGVVIATSGMLTSGPVVTWARRVLPDPASAVLLVGYQDSQSPGGRLLDLAADPGRGCLFELPDRHGEWREIEVESRVETFSLAAHANSAELVEIADRLRPRQVMLVHGDKARQRSLASRMLRRGHQVTPCTQVWRAGPPAGRATS